ncbi:MAG: hypothetical protein F4Y63_00205 [Chloroflexi bacterium]|nr:hypothetical protein [Chloroflexota bacterium]MYK61858.1 hypothetical protein [Chloroflexota bacterium]
MITEHQAIQMLREAYENAPHGEKMLSIQLFGIRHADQLEGMNLSKLASDATGKELGVELNYGVKLSRHVVLKQP